jgi:hypothetical protein
MNGTDWSSITTFESILSEANRFAPFWAGVLFMVWIVLVVTFLPFGVNIAFISGSFLALLLGVFLGYMGLVAWKFILGLAGIILLIVIIDALFAKKES